VNLAVSHCVQNYDPLAEARALDRAQQKELEMSPTTAQKMQAAEAEHKWLRFQEREEKVHVSRLSILQLQVGS